MTNFNLADAVGNVLIGAFAYVVLWTCMRWCDVWRDRPMVVRGPDQHLTAARSIGRRRPYRHGRPS